MKIAIAGAGGRMGRALIEAVAADRGLTLGAAFDVAGSPAIGEPVGKHQDHFGPAARWPAPTC